MSTTVAATRVRFLTKTLPSENPDPDDRCAICWMPLTDAVAGHTVFSSMAARAADADAGRVADVAKHFFHEECIQPALSARQECPTCARPVINAARLFPDGIAPPLLPLLSPIIQAAEEGNLPLIEFLIEAGGISETDLAMALSSAAQHGHAAVVQRLLTAGVPQCYRHEALCRAAGRGHTAVVQRLLIAGGVSGDDLFTALLSAARRGRTAVIQTLLTDGRISETHLRIAMYEAATEGQVAAVQIIAGSFSAEHQGNELISAARHGYAMIVTALLETGNISEEFLRIATHEAEIAGHRAIAEAVQQALLLRDNLDRFPIMKYFLIATSAALIAKLLWDRHHD